ncbi:MAG: hypothetical protein KBT34_12035 [Prevotella sp.]|nr:hypothetical protein [Candidatus Prevotella equi]
MARILKTGDRIRYKMWSGETVTAGVLGIELCKEGMKSGRPVKYCDLDKYDNIVLDLDNQHWAYGYQVKEVLT